ncbi:MAG: CoA-binding protein [Candidatus Bathyarchaeota archaeon]|nr:CoA-binding protein [Candidatus Bathyarchaeota archaeon]
MHDDDPNQYDDEFIKTTYQQMKKLIEPKSVAIIGASDKIDKVGGALTRNAMNSGYEGKIYLVNPKVSKIFGEKTYPTVDDIPEEFDLAEIVVPAKIVPEILEQVGRKKASGAIIISSGFAETGNKILQEEAVNVASKNKIRLIGPNCFGIINTEANLDLTFTFTSALKGSIAFISQSGAMCCGTLDWAYNREIGFSKFINLGNECDVDVADILAYLSMDPQTKVIGIYMEGIKKGRKLIEIGNLVTKNKPIVVLKSGSSEAGARASLSHTGSIAGSNEIVDVGLKQANMFRVYDVEDIFDASLALANQPLPNGKKVGIISNAGGLAVMVSDWCSILDLKVPIFSSETQQNIKKFLSPIASFTNPVDMTGGADYECYKNVLDVILNDPLIHCAICIFVSQGLVTAANPARAIVEVSKKYDKPVLAFWMGERSIKEGIEVLKRGNVPAYPSSSRVAKSAYALFYYAKIRGNIKTS